jgi:hypothetical protein
LPEKSFVKKRNSTPHFFKPSFNNNFYPQLGKRSSVNFGKNLAPMDHIDHNHSGQNNKNPYLEQKKQNFNLLNSNKQDQAISNPFISKIKTMKSLKILNNSNSNNFCTPPIQSPLLSSNLEKRHQNSHLKHINTPNPFFALVNNPTLGNLKSKNFFSNHNPFNPNQNTHSPLNKLNYHYSINENSDHNLGHMPSISQNAFRPMSISSKNYITNINKFVLKTQPEIPNNNFRNSSEKNYSEHFERSSRKQENNQNHLNTNNTNKLQELNFDLAERIKDIHLKGPSNSEFRIQVLNLLKLMDKNK